MKLLYIIVGIIIASIANLYVIYVNVPFGLLLCVIGGAVIGKGLRDE